MGLLSAPVRPIRFQRAMVFVDGTNLFHRFEASEITLHVALGQIFPSYLSGRQLIRSYLYTIERHVERARKRHGDYITQGVRVILGHGIQTGDGNVKEKGVDALLVADLIYHAAAKNYDYVLLVSVDTDFVHALRRVEDFGCRTGVLAVCSEVPDLLRLTADECLVLDAKSMIDQGMARAT